MSKSDSRKGQFTEYNAEFKSHTGHPGWFSVLYNGTYKDPTWGKPFSNARWAASTPGLSSRQPPDHSASSSASWPPHKRSIPGRWRRALMATCFVLVSLIVIVVISLYVSGAVLPHSSHNKKGLPSHANYSLADKLITLESQIEPGWKTSTSQPPKWSGSIKTSSVHIPQITTAPKQNTAPTNTSNNLPTFIRQLSQTLSIDAANGGQTFLLRDETASVPLTVTDCLDFYSFHEGFNAKEGTLQPSAINNVEACKENCDESLTCTAFSFNRDKRQCFLVLMQPTSLVRTPGVTYYIRHGCHYCLLFEKRENTHAYGGREQSRDINTEEKCFKKCTNALVCWGFDFSRESSRCYLHFNVISPVSTSGNIVQYGRIGCNPDCTTGYSVNSGIDVISGYGSPYAGAKNLPDCQRVCDSQTLCLAFSFSFSDNSCRIFYNAPSVITANPWASLYNKPYCTVNNGENHFSLRLVGGSTSKEGRLEIKHKGKWGTVCDDHFTDVEAAVICQQLGYGLPAKSVGGAFYGQASANVPIWLDDLTCSASSASLKNCTSRGWGIHNCRHHEDVGVACGSQTSLNWQVRLNGGRSSQEGHVQVRLNKTSPWYYVCDDYWDYVNSDVVCKQLGLGNFSYAFSNSNFGQAIPQFLLDDIRCDKGMTSLRQCSHRKVNSHDCRTHEIAGVQCFFQSKDRPSTNVRLAQGASPMQGRLEVYYNEEWGTVCDDSFDNVDASVICRELGFKYGRVMQCCQRFPQGSGKIWLDTVECDQDDRSVFDCKHDGWGRNDCTHGEDVGLQCYEDLEVRLVDGLTPHEGRLEVKHQGEFGTVCDDNFGTNDAVVFCRMLGYIYGEVKKFPVGKGRIWLDEMECKGNEREIFFCEHNSWGDHNCTHSEDVGVICFYRSPTALSNGTAVTAPLNSMKVIRDGLQKPALFSLVDKSCTFDEDLCDIQALGWKQYSNFKVDSRIRLVGGSNEREGRVEVLNSGEWGSICHRFWDDNDARAVCKMFGYPSGTAACCSRFGQGLNRLWLSQINCNSTAKSLWDCTSAGWGVVSDCQNRADAGVVCSGNKPTPTFDVTYLGTDMVSPMSTLLMEVQSAECIKFKYRMPKGLYIYVAGAEAQAFTPFTFNPVKAGGLVITEATAGIAWKEAELSVSSDVRHVFWVAMAANGSQIQITNITVSSSSCLPFVCPSGTRKCQTVDQCYAEGNHCDAVFDCLDSSDENFCQPPFHDCQNPRKPEVTTTTVATTTSKPERCLEKTVLGTGEGAICFFPFLYKGKYYYNCTMDDHHYSWCSTTHNFDRDKKWGNCDGCTCPEKTNKNQTCHFPFTYKGRVFYTCTTVDFNQRWCSFTPTYANQWGICEGCDENFNKTSNKTDTETEKPCVPYTRRGNADGAQCHFPFLYKGSQYFSCTNADHSASWCSVVPNYDAQKVWGQCAGCEPCVETTILGNGGEKSCAIPFVFEGKIYNSCTMAKHNTFWCAVTPNYDTDQLWGVCNGGCDDDEPSEDYTYNEDDGDDDESEESSGNSPNGFVVSAVSCRELTVGGNARGSRCLFPFLYDGQIYRSCTAVDHHRKWCAVTFHYDRDRFWGNCIGCPVKASRLVRDDAQLDGPGSDSDSSSDERLPLKLKGDDTFDENKGVTCIADIHSFNDGSLDGATQKASNVIKWKNVFGNTPTNETGPSLSRDYLPMTAFTYAKLDRAFQGFNKQIDLIVSTSEEGRYIYAEMSAGDPGTTGSVTFTAPHGALYLRFHYHMTGRQVGSLSVAIDDVVKWKVEGDQFIDLRTSENIGYPSSWRFAQINLPAGTNKVDFIAKKGNGPLGDIAIDNVAFAFTRRSTQLASFSTACPTGFFRCGDGNCIPQRFICDGIRHCGISEDESGCPESACQPGFYDLCADRRCLPASAKCDSIVDCDDESDEMSCGVRSTQTTPIVCNGFRCADGSCIASHLECDELDHCPDGSDEICTSSTALFHCSYGQVLTISQNCDGTPDCFDASDEQNCGECEDLTIVCQDFCVSPNQICNNFPDCPNKGDESGNCICRGDQFLCDTNKCISKENFCDGTTDCDDKSDEPDGCKCSPIFHMTCGDGTCLGWSKRCDSERHCSDYSDEIGCGDCKEGWKKCDVDYCIPSSQWCDGISHCPDSSDERINCTCEATQFACGDRCVPLSDRCNKQIDCSTSLDEMGCTCSHNEKPCKNGVCLEESKFCNGVFDCEDSSDEFQCKCSYGQFSCFNGLCIDAAWRCNYFDNCGDESDEIGCPCQDNEFICNSTGRCIAKEYRCDGVRDCAGGDDEVGCNPGGPVSCPANQIACNFTCVSNSYRCNGKVDCTNIPAGSDETKCVKQQPVTFLSSVTYVIHLEKEGTDYVICYDPKVWTDQWSQAVCMQLGQGPLKSMGGIFLLNAGITGDLLYVNSPPGDFLQNSLISGSNNLCSSRHAVAIVCHPPVCGQRAEHLNIPNALIVGGEISHPGMWPWQAQIKTFGSHHCGATLINEEWAITAAHCVVGKQLSDYMITVGSIYRTKEDPHRQTRYVKSIIVHPSYSNQTFESDIALMKLGLPLTLTDYVRPACLPQYQEEPAYRDECQLTGWGSLSDKGVTPEQLRDARFTIWNDLRCASYHPSYKKNTMLCAGKTRNFASACFGDSGGPLVCRDSNDRWTLAGIVSWAATPCAAPPTYYVRVSAYTKWIKQIMSQNDFK